MSTILKSLKTIQEDYNKKIAGVKDGLRKEVMDALTTAKDTLDAAPDDIRREILDHREVKGLIRAMGGSASNGTGAKGGKVKVSDDAIADYCSEPRRQSEINKNFGFKNLSTRLYKLADDKKIKKTQDDKWVRV